MKTKIFLTGILLLLFSSSANCSLGGAKNAALNKESVTIICTPDLYLLTSKWAGEYNGLNPGMKIEVLKTNYNSINLGTGENLSFVSNKSQATTSNETTWKMVVGRDIIVPVINSANPFMNEIVQHGVSPGQFKLIVTNANMQNWGALVGVKQNVPVHIYMVNNESIKTGVAKFIQVNQVPVSGITFGTKDEIISAIQKDPYAIGFCNVVDILSPDNQSLAENIRLLPVDKNGNGTIDNMENIYSNATAFIRGVWIGKYPKALYSNIYAVSKLVPTNDAQLAFLTWVLTDGQKYMNSNGFCELAGSESQSQLDKINTAVISVSPVKDATQAGLVLLILAVLITSGLIISAVIRNYRKQENVIPDFNIRPTGFDENSVIVPKGLYFDKTHTWAFMEKDGNVTIGIDDFLQHITGTITRIEMKNAGEKIKKGDLLFSIIQSGKQLNLYAPVSGIVIKQNETLVTDSSIINSSPYADGWVYRIEPTDWTKEIQFMEMAEKYKRWLNTEFSRIKDFLAATLKPSSLEYSHVVLQDGGALKDGILSDFGPQVWEDFQTNFLDIYK